MIEAGTGFGGLDDHTVTVFLLNNKPTGFSFVVPFSAELCIGQEVKVTYEERIITCEITSLFIQGDRMRISLAKKEVL